MESHLRYCGQHDVCPTVPNIVALTTGETCFGRSSGCTVVLDSPAEIVVSRKHASITRYTRRIRAADGSTHVGCWVLRDHGSRNGTFVNYVRVQERELRFGDVIHFGGGTRAPFEGLPVAGISSQFIYVFLEGVPGGNEESWAALPRLEHAPPTPMNDSQRRNFLERQGLRLADGDHAREAAAMVRIVDDTVQGSRGSSPAASVPGEAGDPALLAASPDGATGLPVGQHPIQQQFGEGFALAHQFGHGGMPAFQPHVSSPMLQFRGSYHPMHPFPAGSFPGSGFRTIHPGMVGAHPLGHFSVGGYGARQQLQHFEAAPRHPEQAYGAAEASAPETGVASIPHGGASVQWQSHTPTNRRAGATSASPPTGHDPATVPGSFARAPPGASLLNALLSSARVVRSRRGIDSDALAGGVASGVAEPATAPAAVRLADSDVVIASRKQQVCSIRVRGMLAGLPGIVAQGAAPVPAAATPCVPQVASGHRGAANGPMASVTASGSPHQLVGGTQGAFVCGKEAGALPADATRAPAPSSPAKVAVSLVPVNNADATGWDASDAGCGGGAVVHTARSTPLGAPVSAPAVVRPSAKRPCLASPRPSVAEAVQAELLALPSGWDCAPASAPPQLRGDCHEGAMATRQFAKSRASCATTKRHAKAPRLALTDGRNAGKVALSHPKAGSAAEDSDSPGTGASHFHKASRARRQRRALKRRRNSDAAAEAVFAAEPQPRFACGASLTQVVSASLGPGACSAVPASVLCSAIRSDDAGRCAPMEASGEVALAGAICQHTPTAHARSGSRSLGAIAAGAPAAGHPLTVASDLGNSGISADGAQGGAQAAVQAALSCRLCNGLLVNAASLGCGHSFCFSCVAEALMRHSASPSCPTCSSPATAPGTRVLPLADHVEVQALALEAGTAAPLTAAVERLLQRVAALDVLVAVSVAALGADARKAFSSRVGDHEAHAVKRGLCLAAHRCLAGATGTTIGASAAAKSPAGVRSAGGSSGVFGRSPLRCSVLGAGRPDDEVMAEEAASLRPVERIASAAESTMTGSHANLANPDYESDDDESDDDEVDFVVDPVSATFAYEDPTSAHSLAGYDAPLSNGTSRGSSDPGLVAAAV